MNFAKEIKKVRKNPAQKKLDNFQIEELTKHVFKNVINKNPEALMLMREVVELRKENKSLTKRITVLLDTMQGYVDAGRKCLEE